MKFTVKSFASIIIYHKISQGLVEQHFPPPFSFFSMSLADFCSSTMLRPVLVHSTRGYQALTEKAIISNNVFCYLVMSQKSLEEFILQKVVYWRKDTKTHDQFLHLLPETPGHQTISILHIPLLSLSRSSPGFRSDSADYHNISFPFRLSILDADSRRHKRGYKYFDPPTHHMVQ